MGRKIPGRKHRGVRDPEKQAAVRFNSIKDKINAPPTNPEDQQVSKTLQRVIDLKNKVKNGGFNKRKKPKLLSTEKNSVNINKSVDQSGKYKGKPEKPVPVICQNVTKEAAFEEKYGVEIRRNEGGEVEVVKRPKDELEVFIKKARKEKNEKKLKKKKKALQDEGPRLTKSQKWQKKKNEKKLKKKLMNADEFSNYKDQPGKKNLLLKTILEKENTVSASVISKADENLHKTNNKTIDKKGKRRDLPNALRRQLDKQQKEIISAYKVLKAKKYSNG
ncbi:hypothetical protein NQ314_004375 [Rhamnusium bicolor]|uniref:Coiled-coil domain-containing protein 137 n=1 Tax=Rhamnusium bicolor TaxID=1586634 RepID=A0AAV8ZJQ1_9CUCU|nr:hypothetical protein NQ314_004375 [Rhamnusium bicolor]